MESETRPVKIRRIDKPQPCPGAADTRPDHTTTPTIDNRGCDDASGTTKDPAAATVLASKDDSKPLSKNQQKKLRRRQEWDAKQPLRKAKKKELRKAKRERDRARKANEDDATKEARAALRRDGKLLPVTVIMDCGYDELMYEKEIVSLGSQLTRCYSENRNAKFKAHLVVSSFGGRLKERFDTVLKGTYKSWQGFKFTEDDFAVAAQQAKPQMDLQRGQELEGAFAAPISASTTVTREAAHALGQSGGLSGAEPPGDIIYLSSDSDYTLTELQPFSTYIIGGLVDRNRYKGKCYKSAEDAGVKTARLPIGEYLEMSTRHILTTNHVLEIMLRWLELRDWGAAFTAVIPKRKGGVLKGGDALSRAAVDDDCVVGGSDVESDSESDVDDHDEEEEHPEDGATADGQP